MAWDTYIEGKNSFLCYRSVNYHELFLVKTSVTEPIAKIKIFLQSGFFNKGGYGHSHIEILDSKYQVEVWPAEKRVSSWSEIIYSIYMWDKSKFTITNFSGH